MLLETILGGVTGLVGNIVTSVTNFKTQKLKNEHDAVMYDYKIKELTARTDAAIKITDAKIAGAIELADSDAFKESQKYGNQQVFSDTALDKLFGITGWLAYVALPTAVLISILLGFVEFLKGVMRPGLTLYLMGCTTWITWMAWDIMQTQKVVIDTIQAVTIFTEVTSIVVYLTISCVTWWFGDRRIAKFLMRMDDGNIKKGKNPEK
jgi:hypothetical protein